MFFVKVSSGSLHRTNYFQFFKDDETIPDGEEELPTDVDIGMAVVVDSADVFRHLDFFEELKSGLQCPVCFGPAWTFRKIPKSENKGVITVRMAI